MALPPLEGDIVLKDNFAAIAQRAEAFAAQIANADKSVANLNASLAKIGSAKLPDVTNKSAGDRGASAAAKAEAAQRDAIYKQEAQQRVITASQSIGQISNLEKLITTAARDEAARRTSLTSAEGQQRRSLLEGALKGLSTAEVDKVITRLGDLGREAQRVRQRIAEIDKGTTATGGGNQARVAATRSEVAERERLIRQLANIQKQEERAVTDAVKAEAAKRAQADQQRQQQQQNFTPGNVLKGIGGGVAGGLLGGDVGALVGGAAAGGPIGLIAAAATQAVVKLEALGRAAAVSNTELKRLELTFNELAGSTAKAEGRIIAIQAGLGGTVDRMTAMKVANQAAALSLASTGAEFGRLAQAARIVSIISPVINDASSAVSELGLAAANLSFRRLDQLGLSVGEVRAGMKALQAENSNLSDSTAFLEAAIDALIAKGGDLVNSTEAQASGVERLQVAWSDWWNQQSAIAQGIDGVYGKVADALNRILVLTGQAGSKATGDFIDAKIQEFEDAQKKLEGAATDSGNVLGLGAAFTAISVGDGIADQLDAYKKLKEAKDKSEADLVNEVPGAKAFDEALQQIAVDAERGFIGFQDVINEIKVATIEYEKFQKLTDPRAQDIDVVRAKRAFDTANANEFKDQVTEINSALAEFDQFQGTGLEEFFASLTAQGEGLTAALESTGELPEGGAKQLSLLKGAAETAGAGMEFLEQANDRLGAAFVRSNESAQGLVEAYVRLKAAQAAGEIEAPAVAEGLRIINEQMDKLSQARELSFTAGLEQASKGIGQVDALTRSGILGLEGYGKAFADTRAAIIENGSATQEQLTFLANTKAAIEATAATQTRFAQSFAGVNTEFINASAAAQALVAQIAQISAAEERGEIATSAARQAIAKLTAELQRLEQTNAADALSAFGEATGRAVSSNVQLVDSMSGLPIAFDIAKQKGDALSGTLNQLIADAQNLGAAAANSSFSLAKGLIPSLGIGGALQQAQQFQSQSQALTNTFLQGNNQRVQSGQSPIDTKVLDFAQSGLQQFQQAFVQDATRAADDIGGAVSDIGKQIDDALDGVISGIIAPTTGGLIPDDIMENLLGRDDEVDENARRLADVAVNGFKSPWVDGLRDLKLIPEDVFAEGEEAVRRFAAEGVRKHTEGLTTDFLNVDAAVQQVIEKLQANQARAGFLDQVREQVKLVAGDVDDLDLQEALGIDVAPQRAARAQKSALEGLPTPEEFQAQMEALFKGEGSPIAAALTVTPEQQGVLTENSTATVDVMGEAMVAQAETGNYGPRAMDALVAGIENKKVELQKSGREAGDWLGMALLEEFKTSVPKGLLDIMIIQLVPLLAAAQANAAERTGGTAVQ
jgi:hypothetical protein